MIKILILALFSVAAFGIDYNEKNDLTGKIPGYPFSGSMYSGFIVVDNKTQSNLFYHLYSFNQTNTSVSAPLVIWLQGGPGCSSLIADYVEFGPVYINQTGPNNFTYYRNPYTWNNYAHLLFVDQPTGTGFSVDRGLKVNSTAQAAQLFNVFLDRFFALFPELKKNDLYIFGESYGGKYVPYFSYYLLNNATFMSQVKLKGIGLGNGWSDPVTQVRTYANFGYAAGLIDQRERDILSFQEAQVFDNIAKGNFWNATNISNTILEEISQFAGNVSDLNFREYSDLDDGFANWLNSSQGQDALGVPPTEYDMCNSDISDDFYNDNTQSVAYVYPTLFTKIPVLIYNGVDDDNCDYEGVINYLNMLNWPDVKKFRKSERKIWKINNTVVGATKSYGNFTFAAIYNAGHMVPLDQPAVALEMFRRFINNLPINP